MGEIILPKIVAIGIYNSDVSAKNKTITSIRKGTMFEIDLPIENGGVAYIDSEQTPITPNMIICMKPGQERHTRFPYKCYFIHMTIEGGDLYDTLMKTPSFIPIAAFEEYLYIFKSLYNHRDTKAEANNIILQSLILKLIHTLITDAQRQMRTRRFGNLEYDKIEQSVKYIKEHLSEDLSLEAMARLSSYSKIHFHNCFKAAVGKTLHEYVEDLRIKKSIILLSTTSKTLTEIAAQCGFSSQTYFSSVFKRRMHITPRDYVKEEHKRYLIE